MHFSIFSLPVPSNRQSPLWQARRFACFGAGWDVPAVYWFFGGDDPVVYAKAKKRENELASN